MGTPASIATVPQILKEIWLDEIYDFMYEDQPFLGLVEKDTSWDGLITHATVQYGGMAGRSSGFGNAQAHKSPPKYKRMDIETRDNFALFSVDNKLITLSRNTRGALVKALAENSEKAMTKLKRSSCWMFWRNGGGSIGKISAIVGSTITLVDKNDVRNVDIDDAIDLSVDDGTGGAGVEAGGPLTITGIDEDTGVITFATDVVGTIATAAVGDFIFHNGDYNLAFSGVPAYVTLATPGTAGVPTSIWSMNRTDFPTRLAGHRFTGTVATAIASISNALAAAYRRHCKITHLFCSPEIFAAIEATLQTSKRYVDEKASSGVVGFKALEFCSQGGQVVKVYPDADIPKSPDGTISYVFGLNLDTWKFHTADSYPMDLASVAGNNKYLLEQTANQVEGRLGGYGNLYTTAPGSNFVLALT